MTLELALGIELQVTKNVNSQSTCRTSGKPFMIDKSLVSLPMGNVNLLCNSSELVNRKVTFCTVVWHITFELIAILVNNPNLGSSLLQLQIYDKKFFDLMKSY